MNERRNDLEIMIEYPQIALQIPNSDRSPLYDVRNPARASREGRNVRSDVSRTMIKRPVRRSSISSGGARRDRTDDLMLAKHALSQLSYGPVPEDECFFTRSPSLALRRSSLRSRRPAEPKLQSSEGWWAWEDLNFRPHAYQARALTN
jgi:hypothetical protein